MAKKLCDPRPASAIAAKPQGRSKVQLEKQCPSARKKIAAHWPWRERNGESGGSCRSEKRPRAAAIGASGEMSQAVVPASKKPARCRQPPTPSPRQSEERVVRRESSPL